MDDEIANLLRSGRVDTAVDRTYLGKETRVSPRQVVAPYEQMLMKRGEDQRDRTVQGQDGKLFDGDYD